MENLKPVDAQMEGGYDGRAVEIAAAKEARDLIAEHVTAEVPAERYTEMQTLMEDLAPENENRFVVEAIARQLSIEKSRDELEALETSYPLAA